MSKGPKSREMIGFGMCCGVVPEYVDGITVQCPECGHKKGAFGGGTPFLRQVWNKSLQRGSGAASTRSEHKHLAYPVLYRRRGWRSCDVEIQLVGFGYTTRIDVPCCLFYTKMRQEDMLYAHDEDGYSCAIDKGRSITDIDLQHPDGTQIHLAWPPGKRYPYSRVYATTSYRTDGTYGWNITVHCVRASERDVLKGWAGKNKD